MTSIIDGPASDLFSPLTFKGNITLAGLSERMAAARSLAPKGACVCWGIPFEIRDPILVKDEPVSISLARASSVSPRPGLRAFASSRPIVTAIAVVHK